MFIGIKYHQKWCEGNYHILLSTTATPFILTSRAYKSAFQCVNFPQTAHCMPSLRSAPNYICTDGLHWRHWNHRTSMTGRDICDVTLMFSKHHIAGLFTICAQRRSHVVITLQQVNCNLLVMKAAILECQYVQKQRLDITSELWHCSGKYCIG